MVRKIESRTLTWVRGLKRSILDICSGHLRHSRTLTWVRGLKHGPDTRIALGFRRTLTWVRGLKHIPPII